MRNPKLFVYDLETTGLFTDCAVHQIAGLICEIKPNEFSVLKTFNYKCRPFKGDKIYPDALEVGGISLETLKAYPDPVEVYNELRNMILKYVDKFNSEDKMTLVGYNNLSFDNNMLRSFFSKNNDKYFNSYFWSGGIDVMSEAGRILLNYRPFMPNFKLATVAEYLGIETKQEALHDANYDIMLTLKIFAYCLKNPKIKTLDGANIAEMKNKVSEYKQKQKAEFSKKKAVGSYVIF